MTSAGSPPAKVFLNGEPLSEPLSEPRAAPRRVHDFRAFLFRSFRDCGSLPQFADALARAQTTLAELGAAKELHGVFSHESPDSSLALTRRTAPQRPVVELALDKLRPQVSFAAELDKSYAPSLSASLQHTVLGRRSFRAEARVCAQRTALPALLLRVAPLCFAAPHARPSAFVSVNEELKLVSDSELRKACAVGFESAHSAVSLCKLAGDRNAYLQLSAGRARQRERVGARLALRHAQKLDAFANVPLTRPRDATLLLHCAGSLTLQRGAYFASASGSLSSCAGRSFSALPLNSCSERFVFPNIRGFSLPDKKDFAQHSLLASATGAEANATAAFEFGVASLRALAPPRAAQLAAALAQTSCFAFFDAFADRRRRRAATAGVALRFEPTPTLRLSLGAARALRADCALQPSRFFFSLSAV